MILWILFRRKVGKNACILDFGCGSGRDTKFFSDCGYQVEATDGSLELCRAASEYTGIHVKQMLFQEMDVVEEYDGIWACASILHVKKAELPDTMYNLVHEKEGIRKLYESCYRDNLHSIRAVRNYIGREIQKKNFTEY